MEGCPIAQISMTWRLSFHQDHAFTSVKYCSNFLRMPAPLSRKDWLTLGAIAPSLYAMALALVFFTAWSRYGSDVVPSFLPSSAVLLCLLCGSGLFFLPTKSPKISKAFFWLSLISQFIFYLSLIWLQIV